ncbi:PAS domain-containing sensor histidine kinase [Natronococcus pandeyae]|uniref:histidine kinase n=1 Tax=Natronococcus pandeyae TaxID=2055836 RepID=A0A8J8TMQ2_9EURY|nr:PAS domain-containing protein [Natronococcus pandeyae]TYL35841.1 PAS domain-containing sensor histidine kinase [Natronococcus pandeyae]
MTTTEVAEQLDLGRRSTYERLERLVDHDRLETKKVGGNGRVWWQPSTNGQAFTDGQERDAVDSDLGEVFDRISDSFCALDQELRFRYLNDHAADLFGLDEAAIGTDIRNENLTETFESALYEALETQEPVTFEDYYPPWDKWFQNVIYPSESGLSVYSRDITDRKRREQELARYETIVETSPIGITIVGSDGELQFANDRAEEIHGRSKDQINDLSFDDSDWAEVDVDGEPLPGDEKPFAQIMKSGEPVFDHLSGVSRPDGERVWISINGAPVYDDCGEIDSVVFTIEEITDRFERERKLEQYETVVETAHDGIYVLDEERRFELTNGSFADLTSFSRTELLGQHASTVFGDEFASIEAEQWESATADDPLTFEETINAGSNETRTVENRFVLLDEGAREQRIGVIRDVTEREEYRQKLEESNERLEQFAYAVSHDLQEPLRMVTSYLQLLERRYGGELDEDAEEFIDYAVDGAERMREMIDDLLDYSRVETQGDPLEPVELNTVIDDVCTDLQLQIEDSDAHIEVASLPQVSGDRGQLRRVFQNLLSNAIEYSGDEPPRVAVSAEQDGSMWRISVYDEGIGIDPDETDRVFEVFQRLHSRDESEGTGIGLALCRRIVERHGGEIWVDSEPGEGSTFSFTLSPAHDHE